MMKKRPWQAPESQTPSADIPRLEKGQVKKKRKKGAFFGWFPGSATGAGYGALENVAVGTSETAAEAAASSAAGAAANAAAGTTELTGSGLLGQIGAFLSAHLPSSLLGKLALSGFLLVAAGGASLVAISVVRAAPGQRSLIFGRIMDALRYHAVPGKSLDYAAAAARGINPPAPVGPQGGKASDAVAAGGFTGNMAAGAPVSGPGSQNGVADRAVPALRNGPGTFGGSFDDAAGQEGRSLTPGMTLNSMPVKKGLLSGAFAQSHASDGTGGTLKALPAFGSRTGGMGRFGGGSGQALAQLRGMRTEIPGMVRGKTGTPLEVPAQLGAEQFTGSNLIGASAPTAPGLASGTPNLLNGPNATGGAGGGGSDGMGQCTEAQINQGMIWDGGRCVAPPTMGGTPAAPWQGAINSSQALVSKAGILLVIAAVLMILSRLPFMQSLAAVAKGIAAAATVLGGIVATMGVMMMMSSGQATQGAMLTIGGLLVAADGVAKALFGIVIPSPWSYILPAVGGLSGILSKAMAPPPPPPPPPSPSTSGNTPSSGQTGSGSSSSGG